MCVLPVMTYVSKTWTMAKRDKDRLIRTQRALGQRTLHVTLKNRKRNVWIRARTRVTDARERETRMKWQYAGHNRWNAQILNWRPRLGKRERGRPQMRWEVTSRDVLAWPGSDRTKIETPGKKFRKTKSAKWIEEVWGEEEEDLRCRIV